MNTPTPETDANAGYISATSGMFIQDFSCPAVHAFVKADFARKLERERDEASKIAFAANSEAVRLLKERDQLRKVADELAAVVRGEFGDYSWRTTTYNSLSHVIERNKAKCLH